MSIFVRLAPFFCALTLASVMTLDASAATSDSLPANAVVAASEHPELSTFTQLVKQSGLDATLAGAGPVTVFAPTNDAFKDVPAATMDKLAKDPEALKYVLGYHVLPGTLKSADIGGSTSIATLSSAKATVSKAGEFVTIDDALVTQADVATGNGVLHVIDRVLTPPKK